MKFSLVCVNLLISGKYFSCLFTYKMCKSDDLVYDKFLLFDCF